MTDRRTDKDGAYVGLGTVSEPGEIDMYPDSFGDVQGLDGHTGP